MSKSKNPKTVSVAFSRLSAAQKRVAICKDAISQIEAEKFFISRGRWCEFDEVEEATVEIKFDQATLLSGKAVHTVNVPGCSVCALGAVMCSSVRLGNVATLGEKSDQSDVWDQLKKYFSGIQMSMIEACFERRINEGDSPCRFDGAQLTKRQENAIERFADKFGEDDDEARAVAIFKNIIENNGTFKP